MTPEDQHDSTETPQGSWFARASTGLKMLLILGLGLLPLGLIAVLASIQAARDNRVSRTEEVQAQVELSAAQLSDAIERSTLAIRAAAAAIDAAGEQSAVCRETLARLAGSQRIHASYAIFGSDGQTRCSTPGFLPLQIMARGKPDGINAAIIGGSDALRFTLFDQSGLAEAIAEFPRDTVRNLTEIRDPGNAYRLELAQGSTAMVLHEDNDVPLLQDVLRASGVPGTRLRLQMIARVPTISPIDLTMILLPVMMWIIAAIIGWLIVDRLLLRPLLRMQRLVSAYRPGDPGMKLPTNASPAREIGALGEAFNQVTNTIARHEAELEAAVDRQTRLVREVHHRVKNNLQVIASLLNIHSRGSENEEVAAAYASIQRRVDALAVVHRNHYAELEENRGVALKTLIPELAANLRATAPRSAAGMAISLNIEPFHATQDVAVSVAFLVTEVVEYAMFCGADAVRISVAADGPGRATLTLQSEALLEGSSCGGDRTERFDRIVTGLSRQLRSTLVRDPEAGTCAVAIGITEKNSQS